VLRAHFESLFQAEGAVGAYDRVAFTAGQCVFTLDTATQTLLLHSFSVAPVAPPPPVDLKHPF
jgi:hypothetical protein